MTLFARGDIFGRTRDDDAAAAGAAFGAEVDDPVGRFDDVEIVLDHEHRVAPIDEAIEHAEQPADVVAVEAGGRLVEDVERVPRAGAAELGGELDALGFAAGERRRCLAEREIAEADVGERGQQRGELIRGFRRTRRLRRRSSRARRRWSGRGI